MKHYHLRLSDSLEEQLERYQELTDASSQAAVIRDALCVYGWFLKHIKRGHEIVALGEESENAKKTEVSTPGLEAVKSKKSSPVQPP